MPDDAQAGGLPVELDSAAHPQRRTIPGPREQAPHPGPLRGPPGATLRAPEAPATMPRPRGFRPATPSPCQREKPPLAPGFSCLRCGEDGTWAAVGETPQKAPHEGAYDRPPLVPPN